MSKVTVDLTMSLDGFIAGPDQTLEQPLGEGGERLPELEGIRVIGSPAVTHLKSPVVT